MLLRIPLPKEPQSPNLTFVFKGICCANEPGRQGWKSETPGSQDCGSCSLEKWPGKGERGSKPSGTQEVSSVFDSRVTVRSPPVTLPDDSEQRTLWNRQSGCPARVKKASPSQVQLFTSVIPTLGTRSRRSNTNLRLACYEEVHPDLIRKISEHPFPVGVESWISSPKRS